MNFFETTDLVNKKIKKFSITQFDFGGPSGYIHQSCSHSLHYLVNENGRSTTLTPSLISASFRSTMATYTEHHITSPSLVVDSSTPTQSPQTGIQSDLIRDSSMTIRKARTVGEAHRRPRWSTSGRPRIQELIGARWSMLGDCSDGHVTGTRGRRNR